MKRKIYKTGAGSWILIVFLSGIVFQVHAGPEESNILKMGVITSLTGPAGIYGLTTQCSLDAFKSFFNDRGGLTIKGKNYKIDMVYADDKYTVGGARSAVEKLVYTDKVDFLVGSFAISTVAAWAPLAMKEKKLSVIGGPGVKPKPDWPYLFHLSSIDDARSLALCALVKEKFGCKSILYLLSDNLDGKLAKEVAIKQEKERGLEVKGYLLTSPNTTDFYPLLTRALKSNPDFMYARVVPGTAALVVKQARELGYKGRIGFPIVMPGDLEKWQEIAGVEASQGFIGVMGDVEEYSPLGREEHKYHEKMCSKYKSTDIAYTMQPHVLCLAIEKAQSLDPDEILKVLRTTEFQSFHKVPLKAGGEKTYGIKNNMDVPIPYSMVIGKNQTQFLGSVAIFTP
jgi:branched-chain amino acid transport system substrate-binding protein